MKTEIKYYHSPDIENLESYKPEISDNFCFLLQVMAGPLGIDGEESFDIEVCTPAWLKENYSSNDVIIGRHHLIVFNFDWNQIKSKIESFVETCNGNDWKECAVKLSRLGKWEFEDYQE